MKIFIKVKTKARQKKIIKIDTNHFEVSTNVAPEDGKANKDILKIVAKHFDTPISKIALVSGEKSKQKIIEIF